MTQVTLVPIDDLLAGLTDPETTALVQRAYAFAEKAHDGRIRPSGEQFIEHDLAVAQIMHELGVDPPTLAASLLHDSLLPHTGVTEETLAEEFGAEIAILVRGLNQLLHYTAGQQQRHAVEQANDLEGIRRAIITIIEGDIRIILMRMADGLHDLRRAASLDEDQQRQIAAEVMNIYAPLANRLGIWQLKWELEDLSFRYLQPEKYHHIAGKLASRRAKRDAQLQGAVQMLRQKIQESGLKADVTGRSKHIFSIFRKMERKKVSFEHIYDVQAVRIILSPPNPEAYEKKGSIAKDDEDRSLCYQAIAIVHGLWERIPGEFDDYISHPKANGYRSLHTAVIDPETGQTLEVQIRTARMHKEAERGVAAHWAYKEEGRASQVSHSVQKRIKNLRDLLSTMRETENRAENAELLETEVLVERIHVYTPNGDVIDLPVGATPIDFAYQIHTQVGHRCRGARINGKMVSLDYQLRSGEQVEILTTKRGNPSRDWLNPSLGYTQSARTRSKIRQWFRTQERDQNIVQGREVVEREIKRLGLVDLLEVEDIAQVLRIDELDDFLAQVGFGDISTAQINGAIAVLVRDLEDDSTEEELKPLLLKVPRKKKGLTVKGVSGLHTRMGKCCQPLPPEPIIGFITRGKGVTIHRQDCNEVKSISESNDRNRLIDVEWGSEDDTHPVPIVVRAYRRANLIDDMVSILRGRQLQAPKTKTISSGGIMSIYLVVEITDLEQLSWLLQKFEGLNNVIEVKRERWDD